MLVGCIIGPDFETAKREIEEAGCFCDGVELRLDLLACDPQQLIPLVRGEVILTDGQSRFLDGTTISTYHNFDETPENLEEILASLPNGDLYKIATTARSSLDAMRMLLFAKSHPNVVGLCMGPLGQITRILSPLVSNPLNFAALQRPAASGQLTAQDLLSIYNYRALSPATQIFGLIGNPIVQSPSHQTHNAYFKSEGIDAVYIKILLEEHEIPEFFELAKQLGLSGLSVTIPFKEKLFDEIDVLSDEAEAIGAVNTITFENGLIYGENTDAAGALDAIEENVSVQGKKCVVLGAGGSAKAIIYEAKKRGLEVVVLSRRYGNLNEVPPHDILINTTPVEMPIDLNHLIPETVVMDINVNHEDSPLMLRAKELNCTLVYGREMFKKQAQGQFARWGRTLSL